MPIANLSDVMQPITEGEYHLPVVLLVDTSASMNGAPIHELNQGLVTFGQTLMADSLAKGRVDVTVISFNSTVQTELGFRPVTEYQAPVLDADGLTSMNEAIEVALDVIDERKLLYRRNGIRYMRPLLFLLTDGAATDNNYEFEARSRLQRAVEMRKVSYIPMGIGDYADVEALVSYYPASAPNKVVLKADETNFRNAFAWLSNSACVISNSNPAVISQVQLPKVPKEVTVITIDI